MDREKPVPQEIYRHFKGKLYQIITVAIHSETGEELVIYQALYGNYGVYARPLSMFMSEVEHEKYQNVKQKYRFEKITLQEEEIRTEEKDSDHVAETVETENALDEETVVQPNLDLLSFLDADTMKEKKMLLISMRSRITDRLIDDIAAALDVTINEGELEERYKSLMACVDTMERFEVDRLR